MRASTMQTRGQRREQEEQQKPHPLDLAQASKSALQDLSVVLCQRNRLSQQAHSALLRKSEVIRQLDEYIAESREREIQERQIADDQEDHRATIASLKKQLQDQNAKFEQERARLQQQLTITPNSHADLSLSLSRILPQLRGLLDVYDREHPSAGQQENRLVLAPSGVSRTQNQNVTQRLSELQAAFDEDRAQLLEQASDAASTQQEISRRNLAEREAALTCPISLDLFENPVVTECCGKTFSSQALAQALLNSAQCPVCRAYRVSSHATRDMANLVELHRTERSLLGLPENAGTGAAVAAAALGERSVIEERTNEPNRGERSINVPNARQNRNRNQRNDRVQGRSEVPHRYNSRGNAPSGPAPPNASSFRGRRRGGRSLGSRRRRPSRSNASSTHIAAANRMVSRPSTGTTSSAVANVSPSSAVPNPVWSQPWRSDVVPSASAGGYDTSMPWVPYATASSVSRPPLYGSAPTSEAVNFYPYSRRGYYGSSSESD